MASERSLSLVGPGPLLWRVVESVVYRSVYSFQTIFESTQSEQMDFLCSQAHCWSR